MSDALTPLRLAYGLETRGAAAPGHAEYELLRGTARALDAALSQAAPPRRPTDAVLAAIRAAAAEATTLSAQALAAVRSVYGEGDEGGGAVEVAVLQQSREAVEHAFAERPQRRPDAATLDAVLARAAEAVADEVPADRPALAPLAVALGGVGAPSAESAILGQSLDALARAPRHRPAPGALSAVLTFAASASSADLDAVRFVYEGGERPGGVEAVLLEQSRAVVERALVARPQPRPEAAALDAVLARAAEASAQRADEPAVSDRALAPLALACGLPLAVEAPVGGVEVTLLAQTQAALDRLRPARPSGAVVANVLDRAAAARRPARADRPTAAPTSRRRIPAPVWAGGAALMLAALTAIAVLPGVFGRGGTPVSDGTATVATTAPTAAPEIAAVGVEPEAAPPADETTAPVAAAPTVASLAPVAARRAVSPRPAPPRQAAAPSAAPRTAPDARAWETGEDVRALSLRLEEIDRSVEGLAWDEPAEVFGQPVARPSATSAPGIRAVREGAPSARARIQPADSSRTPR